MGLGNVGSGLTLLEQAGENVPDKVKEAEELTKYAVLTRYPGLAEPVTEAQYLKAVALAERIITWVKERLL